MVVLDMAPNANDDAAAGHSGVGRNFSRAAASVRADEAYDDDAIVIKNLWGYPLKRYVFATGTITSNAGRIEVNGKKIGLVRAMLVKSEYDALLACVVARQR